MKCGFSMHFFSIPNQVLTPEAGDTSHFEDDFYPVPSDELGRPNQRFRSSVASINCAISRPAT